MPAGILMATLYSSFLELEERASLIPTTTPGGSLQLFFVFLLSLVIHAVSPTIGAFPFVLEERPLM
jgi:hypothetical protein